MSLPETFDKAEALFAMDPAPEDLVKQLQKLKKETPEKYHAEFNMYFEGAMAMSPKIAIEGD